MLQTLKIKNFALIADQAIEFCGGFNVLVGETGAGKSLILDSLSFALGDKANKLNIRHNEQKMSVQAVFDNSALILNFLRENDIDEDDNLVISRSLTIEGRSDCRINGTIVPVSILKSLGSLIVDTYAQNENIELLKVKNHLTILDDYGGDSILLCKNKVANLYSNLKEIESQIEKLGGDDESRARKLELLEYQIKDIENANLKDGEDDEVKQEIDRLSNFEKIFASIQLATNSLDGVSERVSDCERALLLAERYDESLTPIIERLKSSKIELKDIYETLSDYSDDGFDQNQLDYLNKRYDEIKALKKKYGATISDINNYLNKIKDEYDDLLFGEEKLLKLEKQRKDICLNLYDSSLELSSKRKSCATEIENLVISELGLLGFKNCKFKILFKEIPNIELCKFSKNGLDDVEFLFSANAGEELKSLSKTISGGEMSRFMLALKNVFADVFEASTLVFDEVDTGISGEIGQKVAERLAKLSSKYQLICITHLCQVTAMADNYIYVKKEVENGNTYTKIKYLNSDEIIKYIAVVSGAEPTEVAIKFATELKQKANAYKNGLNK